MTVIPSMDGVPDEPCPFCGEPGVIDLGGTCVGCAITFSRLSDALSRVTGLFPAITRLDYEPEVCPRSPRRRPPRDRPPHE